MVLWNKQESTELHEVRAVRQDSGHFRSAVDRWLSSSSSDIEHSDYGE